MRGGASDEIELEQIGISCFLHHKKLDGIPFYSLEMYKVSMRSIIGKKGIIIGDKTEFRSGVNLLCH